MFYDELVALSRCLFLLFSYIAVIFWRCGGMSFVLGSETVLVAVILAVALVAFVLVFSVRDSHRRDGSVMWDIVAESGLNAAVFVTVGLFTVAVLFFL